MHRIFPRLNCDSKTPAWCQQGFVLLDAILWMVLVSYVFISLMLMTRGMTRSAAAVVRDYRNLFVQGYEYETSRVLSYEDEKR